MARRKSKSPKDSCAGDKSATPKKSVPVPTASFFSSASSSISFGFIYTGCHRWVPFGPGYRQTKMLMYDIFKIEAI
jgi:hypothetical protein